jgi:hypothetical protein
LNSHCFKWGFGRKWGNISPPPYFGCVSLFFVDFDVFESTCLCVAEHVKIGCKKLKGNMVCITKSSDYLQVEDLLRLYEDVVSKFKNQEFIHQFDTCFECVLHGTKS